ncbi:hypothetical protein FocTR4_00012301, partial [Fusarium oxysporum f. sp. cubense]
NRCVSGINNSRLSQRRAKDREAQRASRAGLGRRMEQLERDVEPLKNRQNTAPPVNKLYLRIRLLKEDLVSLLGITSSPRPISSVPFEKSVTELQAQPAPAAVSPRSLRLQKGMIRQVPQALLQRAVVLKRDTS